MTYSLAQKKATYKWRENNREEYNEFTKKANKKWRLENYEEYRKKATEYQVQYRKRIKQRNLEWKIAQEEFLKILLDN